MLMNGPLMSHLNDPAHFPPSSGPGPRFHESLGSQNPLESMASITDSLTTKSPQTPLPLTAQRPLKAILPPITQQQFDHYSHLNTEDVVKKVKKINCYLEF